MHYYWTTIHTLTKQASALVCLSLMASIAYAECQLDNAALQAMQPIEVKIHNADGEVVSLTALHADNNYERSQGFQRVCAERIATTSILFDFRASVIPAFHMNNVVAPIDIAFIDRNGKIESIQSMHPYSQGKPKVQYRPNRPIAAALEVRPGFFREFNVSLQSTVSWSFEPSSAHQK